MRSFLILALSVGVFVRTADVSPADSVPRIPTDFGECPSEIVPFMKHIVQQRAAGGLNAVKPDAEKPEDVVLYGGTHHDANVAWIAAVAYKAPWSRFQGDENVRKRAFSLMDALTEIQPDGKWHDGGLRAYFFPQSFAWAALEWIESGDVDEERAERWTHHARLAAENAMGRMYNSFLVGQYANPEFYYLSGLTATWKLTGDDKYLEEAQRALRRYDEWLYEGGGMAYIFSNPPQAGYQNMVVKSVALYWNLTGDDYALELLHRMSPYMVNLQHRSGLMSGYLSSVALPSEVMLACATGDGRNTRVAEIAARRWADAVNGRSPSFWAAAKISYNRYNYHHTTYAASALRILEKHPLPDPVEREHRRVFVDKSYRGVRSHWDDFTAGVGTRDRQSRGRSMAAAYLADPAEPLLPLRAGVNGVHFEVLRNDQSFSSMSDQDPMAFFTHTDGFAAVGVHGRLFMHYWIDLPFLSFGSHPRRGVSDWHATQNWAVWRDHLIGFGALRYHGDGGREGKVRVRWPLTPPGRELDLHEMNDERFTFTYGGLHVDLHRLAEAGGFTFGAEEISQPPHEAWTPMLVRDGKSPETAWSTGNFVHVGTVIHPAGTEGEVHVKSLRNGAAALMLEPDRKKAFVWVVNLTRQWQGYTLELPEGVECRTYKRDVEMPPVPPGQPAYLGLPSVENGLWVLESETEMSPETLLNNLERKDGRLR